MPEQAFFSSSRPSPALLGFLALLAPLLISPMFQTSLPSRDLRAWAFPWHSSRWADPLASCPVALVSGLASVGQFFEGKCARRLLFRPAYTNRVRASNVSG
ncbi:hypothetical protein LY76DRAFT_170449 [Colletotrichum caudatum]|nr:hypothetical protein LY76DRAFT_170449 [Colletotrichum caudatum]